ncbi:diaminopimelate epimerase [Halobacillus litoralis]|uniref:diaminopimelate epimerase n=1 Tax=Halobacillus litoralis TaxID=45668 RepID=UPI001CD25B02|nr:diaminopimelate epimerase [Halobacillus litoralis]MCA0969538.1 diaminopimelate epimerase [Halobacillus litoralis]
MRWNTVNIPFIKCHGSGNDFILIDEIEHPLNFTEKQREQLSLLLCNREEGIGSDGILFVLPSDQAEGQMRMFNSDGTEAEMCGNGLRCVARHMIEKTGNPDISIETKEAVLAVSRVEPIYPEIDTFSVAIEPVSFSVDSLPMNFAEPEAVDDNIPQISTKRTFTALSVPNPHIVTIVDEVDQEELLEVGQLANQVKDVFPNGVNVSFVKQLEKNKIFAQTYERGVGLTNACGTAMSASSLVSTILGSNDKDTPIVVINKGGLVHCVVKEHDGSHSISLQGNGTNVYQADVEVNESMDGYSLSKKHWFEEENKAYEQLQTYAARQIGGDAS